MKITKVEPFHVQWDRGVSAWVRITDESGQFGTGEITPMEKGNASLELVRSSLTRFLINADPLDAAILQNRMFHACIKTGPGGALAGALAGIDIALWDLKGKLLNQPIYKLLGGAWRTTIPFYASIGGNAHRNIDDILRTIDWWMAKSPSLIKIRFDPDKTMRDADIPGDLAKARAVRKHIGNAFPLAFDGNNGYSIPGAIRLGRELEELGFVWFEEPLQSYHISALEQVTSKLDLPVAAGEQEYTLQGVHALINAGVQILQPDIVKTGGFTGMQQMAALAHTYGIDLLPHQTQPTIGHLANLHMMASILHGHHPCECNDLSGVQNVVLKQPIMPHAGAFCVPNAPGLGIEFDEPSLAERVRPWCG